MLNTSGLSLGQAPPILAPFLLFLVAPAFGIAAGLMLAAAGDTALVTRWAPATLAAVHLAVLGFITPIMGGALLQVLPVLYGAAPGHPAGLSRLVASGLAAGTLGLCCGFAFGHPGLLTAAGVLLAVTLVYFTAVLTIALWRQEDGRGAHSTLRLGIGALSVTALLGLTLVFSRTGWIGLPAHGDWVDIHLAWGLFGWMGLVLISVGSELMPMFYLSPVFPSRAVRFLGHLVFGLLALSAAWGAVAGTDIVSDWLTLWLLAAFAAFTAIAGRLLVRRQRRILDATLGFWWLGLASTVLALVGWLAKAPPPLLGVIAIAGAGMSFTSGALYKIVPFLCWLHLRQRKLATNDTSVRIPTMKSFIPDRNAEAQLAAHSLALTLWAIHIASGTISSHPGSLALTASSAILLFNVGRAYRSFKRQLRALAVHPQVAV